MIFFGRLFIKIYKYFSFVYVCVFMRVSVDPKDN